MTHTMTHPALASLHAVLAALNVTPTGIDAENGSCDAYFYAHLNGADIASVTACAETPELDVTVDLLHPAFWPVTPDFTERALVIGDRLLPAVAGRVRLGGRWINPRAVNAEQVHVIARALREEVTWHQHGALIYRDDAVLIGTQEHSRKELLRALSAPDASGPVMPHPAA